jgi:hypothetical protein
LWALVAAVVVVSLAHLHQHAAVVPVVAAEVLRALSLRLIHCLTFWMCLLRQVARVVQQVLLVLPVTSVQSQQHQA